MGERYVVVGLARGDSADAALSSWVSTLWHAPQPPLTDASGAFTMCGESYRVKPDAPGQWLIERRCLQPLPPVRTVRFERIHDEDPK